MPWPPSLNAIWRAVNGRIVLSAPARAYIKTAAKWLPVGRVAAPLTGRLQVWLTLHPSHKSARQKLDVCNREKILIDVLTKQRIWLDDSQIDIMVIQRGAPSPDGHVDVTIHTIEPGSTPL